MDEPCSKITGLIYEERVRLEQGYGLNENICDDPQVICQVDKSKLSFSRFVEYCLKTDINIQVTGLMT